MPAVACYAHDELNLFGIQRVIRIFVVLPPLELLLVNHDDAVVLVVGPLFFIICLALLFAVKPLGFALFATLTDDDCTTILGVTPVIFGDVCDGHATWAPWSRFLASSTTEGTVQSFGLFHGSRQNESKLQTGSAVVLLISFNLFSAGHLLWFGKVLAREANPLEVRSERVHCHGSLDLSFGPVLVLVERNEDFGLLDGLRDVDRRPAVVGKGIIASLGGTGLALVPVVLAWGVCIAKDEVVVW